MGSFIEHLHYSHTISDFAYLKKASEISETVLCIDCSKEGEVDDDQAMVVVSDELSEMIDYFERVTNNQIRSMLAFRDKNRKAVRASHSRHHALSKPVCFLQNLVSNNLYSQPAMVFSNLSKRFEPETAASQKNCFKSTLFDDVNVEAFDPNIAEETAEESRLASDIFYSNQKSQLFEPTTAIKQLDRVEFLEGLTLGKRESQSSDPGLIPESPAKKYKQIPAANPVNGRPVSFDRRFVNSISLGNLAGK